MGETIAFWSLAVVLVGSALAVVLSKNLFHSVLWLALALTGTAGIFLLLPGLNFLMLLGLYGSYLLWLGLPVLQAAMYQVARMPAAQLTAAGIVSTIAQSSGQDLAWLFSAAADPNALRTAPASIVQ